MKWSECVSLETIVLGVSGRLKNRSHGSLEFFDVVKASVLPSKKRHLTLGKTTSSGLLVLMTAHEHWRRRLTADDDV